MPVTRVATILRYTQYLHSMGAPVARLLARAGIPAELLDHPAAVVPLQQAFRFGELVCRTQGTEHLGLHVGLATSLDDLGSYGDTLNDALNVHDYLRKGVSLYNMLMLGQRLWLSEHGEELRLNIATDGESELGKYQSQMETLVVTIGKLREAAGPDWSPRVVSLAYRVREDLPDISLFAGSRILRGTGETYLTIPRAMMGLRFPGVGAIVASDPESHAWGPLPEDLGGMVRLQIESLVPCRALQIHLVAETLGLSPRTLQRALARQGLTFSLLLAETRMRKAVHWLENTDKPIAEIAFDLCYTDASNFTRAFRAQTGVSPQTFRYQTRRT